MAAHLVSGVPGPERPTGVMANSAHEAVVAAKVDELKARSTLGLTTVEKLKARTLVNVCTSFVCVCLFMCSIWYFLISCELP